MKSKNVQQTSQARGKNKAENTIDIPVTLHIKNRKDKQLFDRLRKKYGMTEDQFVTWTTMDTCRALLEARELDGATDKDISDYP